MSLRNQVPDAEATYADPVLGVNLNASEEDLQAGESSKMKNVVHLGGLVTREGSTLFTPSQIAASYAVLGGHKFYYGTSSSKRLICYFTNISVISDAGSETIILSTQTSGAQTYFKTWPITDKVYISNGIDPLLEYDGTLISVAGSTNIRSSDYSWTLSTGGGTATYYLRTSAGGNPGLAQPAGVLLNKVSVAGGVATALSAGQWGWDDVDTLGYNTVYVRLSDDTDPDTKANGYVAAMSTLTIPGLTGWINGSSQTLPAAKQIIGLSDRLFALTSDGIERCDPRDPTAWSKDSSWATFRPSQSGTFLSHIPHSVSSQSGEPINGALAFTDSDYYFYTGSDFGDDVTAATASTGEDGAIRHIAPIGLAYARAVDNVPGLGTFFITNQKNIYFIPTGSVYGRMVGTKIFNSGGSATAGIESLAANQPAWVVYWEPYLMVSFCIDNGYPETQYWLDMRKFRIDPNNPVWYGPMTGQSPSVVWKENQTGEYSLMSGEGNSTTGVFVYKIRVPDTYSDASGTSVNAIACEYSTYLKSGGAPSREKVVQQIEIEMNEITGEATCDISDISGTVLSGLPIEKTFL